MIPLGIIIIIVIVFVIFVAIRNQGSKSKAANTSAVSASSKRGLSESPAKLSDISPGGRASLSERWGANTGRGSSSATENKKKPSGEDDIEAMLRSSKGAYKPGESDGASQSSDGKSWNISG